MAYSSPSVSAITQIFRPVFEGFIRGYVEPFSGSRKPYLKWARAFVILAGAKRIARASGNFLETPGKCACSQPPRPSL